MNRVANKPQLDYLWAVSPLLRIEFSLECFLLSVFYYWKWNFPMNPHIVCRSDCWSVIISSFTSTAFIEALVFHLKDIVFKQFPKDVSLCMYLNIVNARLGYLAQMDKIGAPQLLQPLAPTINGNAREHSWRTWKTRDGRDERTCNCWIMLATKWKIWLTNERTRVIGKSHIK